MGHTHKQVGRDCGFVRELPFPAVYNIPEIMEGHRLVHQLAASADHVIPGHDPLVMALYPPPSPDLKGLVARLDVAPNHIGQANPAVINLGIDWQCHRWMIKKLGADIDKVLVLRF